MSLMKMVMYREIFHITREKIVKNRIIKIQNYINDNHNCLDVGAGAGTFAKEIKQYVNSIECLELVE